MEPSLIHPVNVRSELSTKQALSMTLESRPGIKALREGAFRRPPSLEQGTNRPNVTSVTHTLATAPPSPAPPRTW